MRKVIITYKDKTTKEVQLAGTLEIPEILFTSDIEEIMFIGKQGQFALVIKNRT